MIIEALFAYIFRVQFLYQTIAALSAYLLLKIAVFYKNRHSLYQLFRRHGIPGPKPNLIGGNINLYESKPSYMEVSLQLMNKYGPVYGLFMGDETAMIITDVDMLKKIFLGEESKKFTERSMVYIDTSINYGILYAPYHRWKTMRRAIAPSFSGFSQRGERSSKFIEETANLMVKYIDHRLNEADATGTKANIDMHSLMKSTALYLISEIALKLPNVKVQEDEENVKSLDTFSGNLDRGAILYAVKFAFLKPVFQFIVNNFEYAKFLALIHRGVNKMIDETLTKLATNTYQPVEYPQAIDTLIKLHYEGKMSRIEVMGNVEFLLIAGYDTTSTTLTYIFWALAKYPDIQERLRAELMAHGTESKYLVQVINETMRLYPSVVNFASRLATETVEVNNWTIPKGVKVMYNAYLVQRDPKLWPNPDQFEPDRFADDAKDFHPCAFAPFGLGERRCLGAQLAMLEMKIIVCDIVLRYRLKLKAPDNLELISWAAFLSKPKEKVMIELERLK